jgi:hypothetical protein
VKPKRGVKKSEMKVISKRLPPLFLVDLPPPSKKTIEREVAKVPPCQRLYRFGAKKIRIEFAIFFPLLRFYHPLSALAQEQLIEGYVIFAFS